MSYWKGPLCRRYTTTPNMVAVSVSIVVDLALCVLQQVARKGVEPLFPPYQSGALNRWTTGLYVDSLTRVGFEPNLSSLKDWQPHQKSNGPCCVRTGCAKWVERCLNPRLRIFSPPLIHLSYRPMIGGDIAARTKKARCRSDTGLGR